MGKQILQFCHGYSGSFLDVAKEYSSLFDDTPHRVTTVFLTGPENEEVRARLFPDEVIFLGYRSAQLRGLRLGAIRDIRRIVSGQGFGLCITHRFKPLSVACLATSLPVIGVHHAFGDYKRPLRRFFVNRFKQRLTLLGVSDAVRDDIRKGFPAWPESKIGTLYNRIEVESLGSALLPRAEARETLHLPAAAYVVANVGRLHPDKDQRTLLKGFASALSGLPDSALLVILGQGRLQKELQSLSETLGLSQRVRFLGQVPHAHRYFRAFDLFVLSSDHEPFGMVLLEAMAAGVPLITTSCGGAPEVVGNLGKLFPFGDDSELARLLMTESHAPESERNLYERAALKRLNELFSYKAGKEEFWRIPGVQVALGLGFRSG
jgi:glycosyltransferase involved in cell wall biosynthesis